MLAAGLFRLVLCFAHLAMGCRLVDERLQSGWQGGVLLPVITDGENGHLSEVGGNSFYQPADDGGGHASKGHDVDDAVAAMLVELDDFADGQDGLALK